MAHCQPEQLKDLASLLEILRGAERLKEKSFGCFYQKSKGVLHFHVKAGRRYAHVWTGKRWSEVDLALDLSQASQKRIANSLLKSLPA